MEDEVNTSEELNPSDETATEAEVGAKEVKEEVIEPSKEIGEAEKPQGFYREEEVPEELKGKWHEMNKAFTESRQEISDLKRKATELDEIMAEVARGEETVEEPEAGTEKEVPSVEDFSLLSPEEQRVRIEEVVAKRYEQEDYPRRLEWAEKELKAIDADPQFTGLLEKYAPEITRVYNQLPEIKEIPDATRFILQALAYPDAVQQGKNAAYAEMKKKKGVQVEVGGSAPSSVSTEGGGGSFHESWAQAKRKHNR